MIRADRAVADAYLGVVHDPMAVTHEHRRLQRAYAQGGHDGFGRTTIAGASVGRGVPVDGNVPQRLACQGLTGDAVDGRVPRPRPRPSPPGAVLALLGPNGAGKTTLLLTLAGLLPAQGGSVDRRRPAGCATAAPSPPTGPGWCSSPTTGRLFTTLTVEENLQVARQPERTRAPRRCSTSSRRSRSGGDLPAGALSGGEQQMLAMARALIQQPKVLLVDEMSMGLAPLIVETLFDTVRRIATDHGAAIVLVEQHVTLALRRRRRGRGAQPRHGRAPRARRRAARPARATRAGLLRSGRAGGRLTVPSTTGGTRR